MAVKSADRVLELTDFPDEIILKVFACLDLKDLLKCGQVAKKFRSISRDQSLWQRIDLSGQNISAVFIQFILERGCKYLDLSHSHMFDLKSTQNIFNNCDQLTELNLENLNISAKESLFLVQNLTSKLKKIILGTLYFKDTDSGITSIIEELKNTLETLDSGKKISYSKLVELQQRMTKLMNLNIRKTEDRTKTSTCGDQ